MAHFFGKCYFHKVQHFGNQQFEIWKSKTNDVFVKGGRRQIPQIRLTHSWNIGYGINILQKTWHFVNFWNFETLKPNTLKSRNFETKKPRNQEPPLPLNIPTPTPATDHPPGGHEDLIARGRWTPHTINSNATIVDFRTRRSGMGWAGSKKG